MAKRNIKGVVLDYLPTKGGNMSGPITWWNPDMSNGDADIIKINRGSYSQYSGKGVNIVLQDGDITLAKIKMGVNRGYGFISFSNLWNNYNESGKEIMRLENRYGDKPLITVNGDLNVVGALTTPETTLTTQDMTQNNVIEHMGGYRENPRSWHSLCGFAERRVA